MARYGWTGLRHRILMSTQPLIEPRSVSLDSDCSMGSEMDAHAMDAEAAAHAKLLKFSEAIERSPHPSAIKRLEADGGKSSITEVTFNFVNTVVGAGIVGLPWVFTQAGFWMTLVELVLCCMLTHYSVKMLIDTGIAAGKRNYEDLCEHALGSRGKVVVSLALLAFDYGALLTYLIILGDASSAVAYRLFGFGEDTEQSPNPAWVRQICILTCSTVLILPFCLFRDVAKLEKLSAISVFTVVIIILIVIVKFLEHSPHYYWPSEHDRSQMTVPPHPTVGELPFFGPNIFKSFSIIAFAFVCHDSAFLIFNTLKNPTSKRWNIVSTLSLTVSLLWCMALAIPGYLTFGAGTCTTSQSDDCSGTKSNLLLNYKITDDVVVFMRGVYIVTMAFTYPLSFFVTRHIVNVWFFNDSSCFGKYETVQNMSTKRLLGLSLSIFFSSVIITLFVSNLGDVMSLAGGLGAVVLAFILPPVCKLKLDHQHSVFFWRDERPLESARATLGPTLLIVFGIAASIGTLYQVFDG